jgi:hypothetical protein
MIIVQDKEKETYGVDLVLVLEEQHTIGCPNLMWWLLMLWLLMRQAYGVNHLFSHIRTVSK